MAVFVLTGILYIAFAHNQVLAAEEPMSFEKAFIEIAATLVKYISMLIWVILSYVGKLMDNNYIFKDSMVEMLRTIWLVVRNLTNVGFAIILLGAAFYIVIFGGSEGGVNIKSALPRFVLGLVLVNFSWLGCTLIIDLSSVVTSAVFSIPQSIQTQDITCLTIDPTSETQKEEPCYDVAVIEIEPDKALSPATSSDSNKPFFEDVTSTEKAKLEAKNKSGNKITKVIKMGDIATIGYSELVTSDFGASNAAMIMAVNLGGIDSLARASKNISAKSGLTLNLLFSLIIIVMVIVPLFALCIVLMARMAVLWLCMAFMPLAFLGLVVKGELTTSLTEGMPNLVDQFIKNAFLPAYVAAPFSVGFLMINAAQKLFVTSGSLQGQVTITVSPTISGVDDTEMILWYLAVAGIIWAGVFTALKGNAITESIVGSIQSGAQGLAKGAASGLTYIPFIPLGKQSSSGKQDMYSLKSLMAMKRNIKGHYDTGADRRGREAAFKLTGFEDLKPPEIELKINEASLNKFIANAQKDPNSDQSAQFKKVTTAPDFARSKAEVSEFVKLNGEIFNHRSADQIPSNELDHVFKTISEKLDGGVQYAEMKKRKSADGKEDVFQSVGAAATVKKGEEKGSVKSKEGAEHELTLSFAGASFDKSTESINIDNLKDSSKATAEINKIKKIFENAKNAKPEISVNVQQEVKDELKRKLTSAAGVNGLDANVKKQLEAVIAEIENINIPEKKK